MSLFPRPARTDELSAAFRLLFGHLDAAAREERVAHALFLLHRGEVDPAGLFVLRDETGVSGAVLCQPMPGAAALIWLPAVRSDADQGAREDALVAHALGWLRQRGVKLVQALLVPEQAHRGGVLTRNGFFYATRLFQMAHDLRPLSRPQPHAPPLVFEPFADGNRAAFVAALLQTHEGSRDCPELNGVRTPEEVLAGHLHQGEGERRWWLVRDGDAAAAVLLLTEPGDSDEWEIAYVGVVPAARRRGVGRAVVRRALDEARAGGAVRLTLAVDARNRPAFDLYLSLGFETYDRREVYLALRP
jgi:ribosomal protein S18 acetylase RimI-like enzyme